MDKDHDPPEIVKQPVVKADYPKVAGEGGFHVYSIPSTIGGDLTPLTAGIHYLGVDAVSWFVNKESTWYSNHMATGILQIALSNGIEQYQAALGTFGLSGGAKVAPVFSAPVLNERNYVGGSIKITATISDIKKDNALALMLKSAADASLGIVSGMVSTATLAGPAAVLGGAGSSLINSIKGILSSTAVQSNPLFSEPGIVIDIDPTSLLGPESFLLFHRGSELAQDKLALKKTGLVTTINYDNKELVDGVWLLVRVFVKKAYTGVRDWYQDVRKYKASLLDLVMKVQAGALPKDSALSQLASSTAGNKTLLDELFRLSAIISSDGVITLGEAINRISELNKDLIDAKAKITGTPSVITPPAVAAPGLAALTAGSIASAGLIQKFIPFDIHALAVKRNDALSAVTDFNKLTLPATANVVASIQDTLGKLGLKEII
jgi:hypothetical protein